MEASTSGVRQACICHHSVKAAIPNKASEITDMNTEVYKLSPTDMPQPQAAIVKPPGDAQRAPRPAAPASPSCAPPSAPSR
ncbi:hypothetical protein Sxan_51080 [Streptomyces xanthophaeus]|uniref:Uncharacterized protein n=1 Tax=Streptomyces xanthophaeus TaxID=67385 RepID=A0A919H5C4_9ACTN|nr:hypothetical protein Sxan_51080 [Streptomyces xanthophaeus]